MVTHVLRLNKPPVRFRAPHPYIFFVLLAVFFLSSPALASEMDYYDQAPQTLAARAASREVLFNVSFTYDPSTGLVTRIADHNYSQADGAAQRVATDLYDVALGVNNAFQSLDSSLSPLLVWVENIHDRLEAIESGMVTKGDLYSFSDSLTEYFSSVFGSGYSGSILQPASGGPFDGNMTFRSIFYSATSFSDLIRAMFVNLNDNMILSFVRFSGSMRGYLLGSLTSASEYLGFDGTISSGQVPGIAFLLSEGFQGLATLIAGQWGSTGFVGQYTWVNPEDPDDYRTYEIYSLFDFAPLFGDIQKSIAKLEFVLANADDIALKKAVEEVTDSFTDNFTGDGPGAVSPSDISDAADLSSGLSGAFSGSGVSSGDVITSINSSESYGFFSQEVLDSLEPSSGVAVQADVPAEDDNFMDAFQADEGGFYSLVDLSPWSVQAFLGGE